MKSAEKPFWESLLMWVFLVIAPALAPAAPCASGRDSLSSVVVEPGVTHISILKDRPFAINVLVVDLTAKNLRLESFRPTGLVPTSEQAKRNGREGHVVLAAINADFFSFKTGWPVNIQVQNGEFVFGTQTQRSHLILDDKNRPHIQRMSFEGWVKSLRGKSYAISGINDVHKEDAIILHTSFSDTATSSIGGGKVISVRLLNASWSVCDTLRMVVNGMGSYDLAHIPQGEAALWIGDGTSVSSAGDEVNVGDTLLVYLGVRPQIRNAKTILGGVGMVVANGKPVSDSINVGEKTNVIFLTARHPRTFVGFDRDTTKLFLCVVDGRQQTSVGMNFHEMAEFLLSLGVWNAVNFDGGGSTTMVVRGKIVNSPSDKTGERPVANSLQIISLGTPASAR
jgi:exopolysaccharide biosynthesis protein